MHTHAAFVISLLLVVLALPACMQAEDRLIPVQLPGGVIIQAEIADTMQKRAQGLAHRTFLSKDRGMLFIFDQAQTWVFWMKGTKIPLDIIWMDEKKRVVHIAKNLPICTRTDDGCPQYAPNDPSLYVLELGGGEVDRLKLERGSKLQFSVP